MSRPYGSKNNQPLCLRGHDIFVVGRSGSTCKACIKEKHPLSVGHPKVQFCPRNHDTFVVGRDNDGRCSECRRYSSINSKLAINLRNRINSAIRGNYKTGSSVKDLGCTIEFLKSYIESKFLPGMSWSNWGRGTDKWHIDHILPLDSFDLSDREQFLKAVNYKNLQPMWQPDNLRKGSKIFSI